MATNAAVAEVRAALGMGEGTLTVSGGGSHGGNAPPPGNTAAGNAAVASAAAGSVMSHVQQMVIGPMESRLAELEVRPSGRDARTRRVRCSLMSLGPALMFWAQLA